MFVISVVFGIIVDFPDSVCFLQRIGIRSGQFLDLLVLLVHKWFTGHFASGCSVFLKLITALLSSTAFLVPSSVVLRFSLDMYGIVGFVVLKLSYQIFGLSNTLLLPGVMGNNGDIIIYALGNFLPLW
jgi:hypothetical protein